MAKVCQLSSVHAAFDVRIFHKECRTLARAGYEVVLIIPHDRHQQVDGVKIHALAPARNRWRRLSGLIWRMYGAALAEQAQIYHFHDPELIPLGLLLKLHRKKVIYDVHEDYAGSLLTNARKDIAARFRKTASKMVRLFELAGARCFDGLVTATPFIAGNFSKFTPALVQNYPLIGELAAASGPTYPQRANQICYVGGLSALRGVREMVQAAGLLSPDYGSRLYLAGEFTDRQFLEELRQSPAWGKVNHLGLLSRAGVAALLAQARVGLVLFHPGPNNTNSQPNKLFEYMSAGLPVIASDFPRWREIIAKIQCGLVVDPLQPEAIAAAITWMFDHPGEAEAMGQRGQRAVAEIFNWDQEARKLLDLYQKVLR